MTPFLWNALKLFNVLVGFILCLWIIFESFALFAIVVALFITYLNSKIDEILERAD
jgi:hypothetical protein